MADDREMIHVRLPKPLIKKLDYLAVDLDDYRSGAVERLLRWAVEEIERRGTAPLALPTGA